MNCRSVSYIAPEALTAFYDYFLSRPDYSTLDYTSQSSVEFRIFGYKHFKYGSAIVITRGKLMGLFIASDGTLTQYFLDNFAFGRA